MYEKEKERKVVGLRRAYMYEKEKERTVVGLVSSYLDRYHFTSGDRCQPSRIRGRDLMSNL